MSGRLLMVDAGDSRNPEGSNLPIARRLMRPGDLLVTPTVNIGWTEWFPQVAGVITERGGILSHTATLARERGIPAVVGAAHCIRRLKGFLRPRIRKLSAGAWAADRVTFDSVQGLIFDRRMPTRHGPGTRTGPATPTTYFQRRSEWPHFVDDSDGRDWTGKPEYPLSALQFDLYYRAWRIAYRRMGLSETQVPLQVSMVTPDPSMKTARRMGRIRPGVAVPSAPGDYRVVAFPTATLSAMGDRILAGGGGAAIPPLVRRLHRERKAAFHRFASLTARMAREADAFVGYDALFEAYSTAIAFAHLRATFRRRVMGPLLDRAMRSLPKEVAATVERALLLGSQGLGTRASQTRTASIRRLLRWAGRPEIRRELERRLPVEAVVWLERMHPTLYARLVRCAETFKLDRSQSDVMQDGPPLEGWVKMIQEYVAAPPSEVHGPVRMRTWKGFEKEVDRLKELVVRPDPAFDFQSFKEVTLMSWEVPGLTEGERHLQHRCQQGLRKVLLRAEEKLHGTRLLPPARSVFDCGRGELQGLLKRLPRGPRHTQPSQRGGH